MPAARTTASTMVERGRRGCMSTLTTRHDRKTPDHGRLARSCERSCRQVGMRLRPVSRVLENSSARVRRSLRCTSITLGILNARAAKHAVPAFLCARSGAYFRSVTGTGPELGAFIGKPTRVLGGAVMLAVLAPAPTLPLAVGKNYHARMMTILSLTGLSNVVAYVCRHSATEDRHHGQARASHWQARSGDQRFGSQRFRHGRRKL
jgi:hypothetical protein